MYQRGILDLLLSRVSDLRGGWIVTCFSLSLSRVSMGTGLQSLALPLTSCVTSYMLPGLSVSSATNDIGYKNLLPPKFLVRKNETLFNSV